MAQERVAPRQKDISRVLRERQHMRFSVAKRSSKSFLSQSGKARKGILALAFFFFIMGSLTFAQEAKVFFSPRGGCEKAIVAELAKARTSIDVAMYYLTSSDAIQRLAAAKKRGAVVRVFVDKSQKNSSETRYLKGKGVTMRIYEGSGLMHNKFAVIDNKVLITGSFNWTKNAENDNQENLLIITDKKLIDQYAKRFEFLWTKGQEFEITRDLYALVSDIVKYVMKMVNMLLKFKSGF